jgi:hypothetical protein
MPLFSPAAAATEIVVALSDETTTLSTGTKLTMRMPYGMTLTAVRSSVNTVSTSGLVTVDINEAGTSILSTKLSIDANEKTSTTAATAAVMSWTQLADDAELTFDIDAAGTGAKGLKVALIGVRDSAASLPSTPDVTFVAQTKTTYATRTTTTVTKPTGTANGDLVLLGIVTGNATEAVDPTPPAGFTLLTGYPTDASDGSFNVEMRVYYRIASSEGASWDFTHSSASSEGVAVTYRTVDTSTPIDVNPSIAPGSGATSTATSVTTTTANAMLIFFGHDWGSTPGGLTPPTGMTERVDTGGPGIIYVAEQLLGAAGATGTRSMTNENTPATSDAWAATLFALRRA